MYKLGLDEIHTLCKYLNEVLENRHIVLLRGDLGSGKTTLVRTFANNDKKTKNIYVTSPTFSLAQSYENAHFGQLYHYDLYRKSLQEMLNLGLLDMFENNGIHFVEWGDENLERILRNAGFKCAIIHISTNGNKRAYKVAL